MGHCVHRSQTLGHCSIFMLKSAGIQSNHSCSLLSPSHVVPWYCTPLHRQPPPLRLHSPLCSLHHLFHRFECIKSFRGFDFAFLLRFFFAIIFTQNVMASSPILICLLLCYTSQGSDQSITEDLASIRLVRKERKRFLFPDGADLNGWAESNWRDEKAPMIWWLSRRQCTHR